MLLPDCCHVIPYSKTKPSKRSHIWVVTDGQKFQHFCGKWRKRRQRLQFLKHPSDQPCLDEYREYDACKGWQLHNRERHQRQRKLKKVGRHKPYTITQHPRENSTVFLTLSKQQLQQFCSLESFGIKNIVKEKVWTWVWPAPPPSAFEQC